MSMKNYYYFKEGQSLRRRIVLFLIKITYCREFVGIENSIDLIIISLV